jgi:hypothetical protein
MALISITTTVYLFEVQSHNPLSAQLEPHQSQILLPLDETIEVQVEISLQV